MGITPYDCPRSRVCPGFPCTPEDSGVECRNDKAEVSKSWEVAKEVVVTIKGVVVEKEDME